VCKPHVVFRDNYLLSFGMFTTKNMPCGFAHVCQSTYNSSRPAEQFSLNVILEFILHLSTHFVYEHMHRFFVLTIFYDSHLLETRLPKRLVGELGSVLTAVLFLFVFGATAPSGPGPPHS